MNNDDGGDDDDHDLDDDADDDDDHDDGGDDDDDDGDVLTLVISSWFPWNLVRGHKQAKMKNKRPDGRKLN